MRALVIYESMYGNTRLIAEAITEGLTGHGVSAATVSVHDATPERIAGAELLVIGGPTHGHGMSRRTTRTSAIADAHKPNSELHLDPNADGDGLREWFDALPAAAGEAMAAAFDTRVEIAPVISGRASSGISKRLAKHGFTEIAPPESFFVTKHNVLKPAEQTRARDWGRALAKHALWTVGTSAQVSV